MMVLPIHQVWSNFSAKDCKIESKRQDQDFKREEKLGKKDV